MKARNLRMLAIAGGMLAGSVLTVSAQVAYVANVYDQNVSVVDLRRGVPITTIPVGCGPRAIVADSRNHRVYVANTCLGDLDALPSTISVIDTTTFTVVDTLAVPYGPVALALDAKRQLLYAACLNEDPFSDEEPSGVLQMIHLPSGTVDAVPLGLVPRDVAISADGAHAYVTGVAGARDEEDHIQITARGIVDVGLLPFGDTSRFIPGPSGALDVSADGSRLYVLDQVTDELVVLAPQTGAEIKRLPVGVAAQDVLFDATHRRVFVSSTGESPNALPDAVVQIDARRNVITATFDGGWAPTGLARVPASRLLLATNFYSGELLLFNQRTGANLGVIQGGFGASAVAVVRR